jgi:hypothetical protein
VNVKFSSVRIGSRILYQVPRGRRLVLFVARHTHEISHEPFLEETTSQRER